MRTLHFEHDESTGLWKWPVLLNGDWSQWTDEPCTILWGQFDQYDYETSRIVAQRASEVLNSPYWPNQTSFRVGFGGVLIIAPRYTGSQALLLAGNINRELFHVPLSIYSPYRRASITWSFIDITIPDWNLPRTLQALVASVKQAVRESRWGSINKVDEQDHSKHKDDFFVSYGRDPLTELPLWSHTLALCSRYSDEPLALLMGDLDSLKYINDMYGFPGGDLSLQMLAHVLRRFESNDVAVFRADGDEFFLWARGYSLKRAEKLAQEISKAIKLLQIPMPYTSGTESVSMTWSVTAASPRDLQLRTLLYEADERLHKMKAEQRGAITTFQM